ncbi:4-hydroxybenzoate polyprenyltransferase [Ancylobacter vacuolatus]|uniref:4-hydroxybenzoate polyprenyltransferase n=1 Tax=Ancylobacter vacuolatus TaxID=223389 RepID=A0ABU0DJS6_9HYPH|nr:4-hydroxybenzoate polyprenyltransferase [Ancylobacter vacuolatus]
MSSVICAPWGFIATGPRSPQPGAPYTYVTTREFLSHFGFDTLRDLPDMEALEDAGLLSKDRLLAGEFPLACMEGDGDEELGQEDEA